MEYMPHQKLSTWIKTNQRADTTQILIILYGVAVGISILHANGIIHSNINISNIFIDENNFPKIGGYDFEYSFYKPIQAWSTKYKINSSSPEILMSSVQSNKIDSRTDSYAFGVIIYNIVTKTQLYQNQNQYQICNSIMNHQIPELEKNNPYREIYDYCCRNERSERPSFLEIVKMLELLSKEIKNIDINRFNQYKEYIHSQHHPSPSFSIEKLLYYSEKNVNVMRYLAVMKAKGIVLPRNAYEAEILLRNGIEKHDFAALETLVEFIDQKYIPIPNDYGELVSFYDNYSC
ncbi:hypothetical protein TRFO_28314 [Tritrichomonas foetus]|uniref:Protein kinase domain-containing protein n=1 Tax=Tritrichomonas foetus TaxID=1144522 RepID=A0A1J4K437_9EUKA|nr:hypothetical protein TRFO_28314 [Tritrichomonas foetus]|eukprot:OHT04261.1 hypothetical protein TRFO_28314 [Tritrichomonas foetus]